MKSHVPNLMWAVRGIVRRQFVTFVIEAPDRAAAECSAWKRGMRVMNADIATTRDIREARDNRLLWSFSHPTSLRVMGRPVTRVQAGFLVLLGLATILLNLHLARVPLTWW